MKDGRILKDTLYGKLPIGTRPIRMPILRFRGVCKDVTKAGCTNPANWETQAADRSSWKTATRTCIRTSERLRREQWEEKSEHKKQMAETTAEHSAKIFKCNNCNRVCGSMIGLYSHSRRCSDPD